MCQVFPTQSGLVLGALQIIRSYVQLVLGVPIVLMSRIFESRVLLLGVFVPEVLALGVFVLRVLVSELFVLVVPVLKVFVLMLLSTQRYKVLVLRVLI